jgi:hypothetical protein
MFVVNSYCTSRVLTYFFRAITEGGTGSRAIIIRNRAQELVATDSRWPPFAINATP